MVWFFCFMRSTNVLLSHANINKYYNNQQQQQLLLLLTATYSITVVVLVCLRDMLSIQLTLSHPQLISPCVAMVNYY